MKWVLSITIGFIALHIIYPHFLPRFISESYYPYKDLLALYFPFYKLTPFANFDGYQYISIAKIGYSHLQQSYFPLFPLIVSWVTPFFGKNYILASVTLNSIFFIFGTYFFYKFVITISGEKAPSHWAIFFLLAFPTSFFYLMVYPESLFFFLSTGLFYFLSEKKYLLAALFAYLASLTKIQGVLLIIPFFMLFIFGDYMSFKKFGVRNILQIIKKKYLLLFASLFPLLGLLTYSTYLFITYNDPLYFYHTQSAFGANRATNSIILLPQVMYRYLKIFLTADLSFTYWIALLEFCIAAFVISILGITLIKTLRQKRKSTQLVALHIYSLAAIVLPTLTGTLTSVPRYALISYGVFIILAMFKNNRLKLAILVVFSILHILLFTYFLKGYFIS